MQQIESLGQGVDELLVLGGILTQIDLCLAVTGIVVILALVEEIVILLVVVLVEDGHAQLVGQLPSSLKIGVAGMRSGSGGAHDDDFGMRLCHALIDILETLDEFGRDLLLVAQAQILQVEGSGMSCVGTHLRPLVGGGVAVGPLDEVDGLCHPLVHLAHGHHVLCLRGPHVPAAVGALAAHAARQDGHGLHAEVFAELEVLEVSQSAALVVAPGVLQLPALLLRADGGLPAVGVPEAVAAAVHHASAGEAHELRLQVGQCLCQILAQAVAFVGVFRHERHLVDVEVAHGEDENLQVGILAVLRRRQHSLILLPRRSADIERRLGQHRRIGAPTLSGLGQHHAHLLSTAYVAEEHGEVVLCAGLHADAVEAVVLQAEALPALIVVKLLRALGVQPHVGGVVGVQRIVHPHLHRAQRVARANLFPSRAGTPSVAVGRAELEASVLHQLGIESAVGRVVDVLEEDTD